MPTTSIAGPLTLTNLGAVTTTFTAPDTCATDWKNGAHGMGPIGQGGTGMIYFGADNCNSTGFKSECFPHGDTLLEGIEGLSPPDRARQPYYSPASDCPSGWTTVGVAAMSDGTASIDGIFSPSGATESRTVTWVDNEPPGTLAPRNFVPNMITSALGPEETAVICCPSGWSANPYQNGCTTSFAPSSLSGDEGCVTARSYVGFSSIDTESWSSGWEEEYNTVEESPSLRTETWEFEGQTLTNTVEFWPAITTGETPALATDTWTFDAEGKPTGFTNRTVWSQSEWEEDMNFTGWSWHPWLVYIHGGDNQTEDGGDGGSAASSIATHSLWAVAGALLAGVAVVAAL